MRKNLAIKTVGLSKNFGPVVALNDVNLEVPEGNTFGYLGPNGSGKTTTVRILSGIIRPTSGSAVVCGYELNHQNNEIKASTGLLPEGPGIYSKLSAVEYLEFVGALYDVVDTALHTRVDKLLGIMGLEGRQDDLLESYSTGMKQKVLVASTLIHDPKLVFLDEPTSRLDPAASALVKDIIIALAHELNTTFFICTHFLEFAQDICNIIGILNSGCLTAVGSLEEILDLTGTQTLEEAYLNLVGGRIDKTKLLDWRS